jgi:hypothetical protein
MFEFQTLLIIIIFIPYHYLVLFFLTMFESSSYPTMIQLVWVIMFVTYFIVGAESSPDTDTTSRCAEIYFSMAGAKQLVTLSFILVPAGAVRPVGVCSEHYIALHRSACTGGLQARRERRPSLQVPEVLIETSVNIVVKAESVRVSVLCHPPAARGLPLLL